MNHCLTLCELEVQRPQPARLVNLVIHIVRASDMSNLLYNLAALQSNKEISPPIIDYDRNTKMLQVVDSTFYFFLQNANLPEIASELPNPLPE
jgi:hypothetical protein